MDDTFLLYPFLGALILIGLSFATSLFVRRRRQYNGSKYLQPRYDLLASPEHRKKLLWASLFLLAGSIVVIVTNLHLYYFAGLILAYPLKPLGRAHFYEG